MNNERKIKMNNAYEIDVIEARERITRKKKEKKLIERRVDTELKEDIQSIIDQAMEKFGHYPSVTSLGIGLRHGLHHARILPESERKWSVGASWDQDPVGASADFEDRIEELGFTIFNDPNAICIQRVK